MVQVVVFNGELREKPESAYEARSFITSYANAPAETIGACRCTCLDTGQFNLVPLCLPTQYTHILLYD